MPLAFDSRTPVDTDDRRRALIRSIVQAQDANGERNWIEWKRSLDLGTDRHQGALAKEILAMSNRDPIKARAHCDGWGYIVVGAHEGGIDGMEVPSTSQLEQKLGKYLGEGGDAPRWEPVGVLIGKKCVLVIGVEPPREGDPIFASRAKIGNAEPGTIYVREIEKAQQASADQLRSLQARLLAGSFEDLAMERLTLVCSSLESTIEFKPKLPCWRPTAVLRPREFTAAYAPEIVVVAVTAGSFDRSLPAGLPLSPLPGACLIVVYPRGADLDHGWQEVRSRLQGEFPRVEADPMQPGKTVIISGVGFGDLHQAVSGALLAAETDTLPMSTDLRFWRLPH